MLEYSEFVDKLHGDGMYILYRGEISTKYYSKNGRVWYIKADSKDIVRSTGLTDMDVYDWYKLHTDKVIFTVESSRRYL